MSLNFFRTRTRGTSTVLLVLTTFLSSLLSSRTSWADTSDALGDISEGTGGPVSLASDPPAPDSQEALATVDTGTGAASAHYGFKLPQARGGAQPSLHLDYNSNSGPGIVGVGWNLSVSSIVRKGAAGQPRFVDTVLGDTSLFASDASTDDFYIDGQLLVPIAVLDNAGHVKTGTVQAGEILPVLPTNGLPNLVWTYFRREVDDGWRYFFNGGTWVVQTKDGHTMQFGIPMDQLGVAPPGVFAPGSTESSDLVTGHNLSAGADPNTIDITYRWNLVRDSDAAGNTVYFVWDGEQQLFGTGVKTNGRQYLTDIYDTLAPGATPSATAFAHHVHLTYELAQYPSGLPGGKPPTNVPFATSPIWRATPNAELAFVDVTSATWTSTQRQLVRSYALHYDDNATQTRRYLASITETGDCLSTTSGPTIEDGNGLVRTILGPAGGGCRSLPATTYSYYGIAGATSGAPSLNRRAAPPFTYTGGFTIAELIDLDGDAVPDLVRDAQFVQYGTSGIGHPTPNATLSPDAGHLLVTETTGDWLTTNRISVLTFPSPGLLFLKAYTFSDPDSTGTVNLATQTIYGHPDIEDIIAAQNPRHTFDIDGDGLPDATLIPTDATNSAAPYATRFTTRDRNGATRPFFSAGQAQCLPTNYDPTHFNQQYSGTPTVTFATRAIADVDGDGINDLVIANLFPLTGAGTIQPILNVLPGHGDGRFGVTNPSPASGCPNAFGGTIPLTQMSGFTQGDFFLMQDTTIRFGDLTGDGLADFATLAANGLHVCVRHGAAWDNAQWQCAFDPTLTKAAGDIQIADLDGTGNRELVFLPNDKTAGNQESAIAIDVGAIPNGNGRAGLLESVSNGLGVSTTLSYGALARATTPASPSSAPVPVWFVDDMVTTNNLSGIAALKLQRDYLRTGAIYDARDRQFLGFHNVQAIRFSGNAPSIGAQSSQTTTLFATTGATTTNGSVALLHASRGLPYVSEEMGLDFPVTPDMNAAPIETPFTTRWNEFQVAAPYVGLDGRSTAMRSLAREHTYVWPEPTPAGTTIQALPFTALSPLPAETVNVPSTEMRKEHFVDAFGNETSTVDFGVVGTDQPILTTSVWGFAQGDATGWNFRAMNIESGFSDSTGSTFSGEVRGSTFQYTPQGFLQDEFATLSGELTLPGPTNGRAAGQPTDASQNGTLHLRHLTYDSFGNVHIASTGLDTNQTQRCTVTTPDALYATFPAQVTVFPAGCSIGTGLSTQKTFDRGFGELATTTSPANQVTVRKFDDFGRLAEIDQPSATSPGVSTMSFHADYNDVSPVRRTHTQTVTGSDQNPTFVDHYSFRDGFGHVLERIDQAQAGSGAAAQWIVSGMHQRYGTGQVRFRGKAEFVPASTFPGGSPGNLSQGVLPITNFLGPTSSFTYDGMGRVLTSTDFDGQESTHVYHSILSSDTRDPEQVNGQHQGAFSSALEDGHGNVISSSQTVANTSHGAGALTTAFRYNAFAQVLSTTQTFPGAPATGVVRNVQYDTLGRLVQSQETNTGTWTYAYNDIGDVVGTADARGCGENIFHDGIGRLVAEDYSPCTGSQAAYTAPNRTTGVGAETFYLYDSPPGMLTASWDQAQHSIFGYDARGRLTGVQRQLATPSLTGATVPPGAGLTISGTIVDAQGNPLSGITVALNGASQSTTQTNVDGGYVFANLVAGHSYSVQPTAPANCTLKASTVSNLNGLTTSQVASFMGSGSGCGGTPRSTPIPPMGNLGISGIISTNTDGHGVPNIEVDLNGAFQAVTHTDQSGFYSFEGLASGQGKNYSLNISNVPSGCSVFPTAINNITATTIATFSASGSCPEGIFGGGALDLRYTPHVYQRVLTYDAANREVTATTGADIPQLTTNGSQVTTSYLAQGIVDSAGSSYGALATNQQVDAAGRITSRKYGDVAGTQGTYWYDNIEQPLGVVIARAPGSKNGAWASYTVGAPTATSFTLETVLSNGVATYDQVGNPQFVTQNTSAFANPNGVTMPAIVPTEWPNGAKPILQRSFSYGDDYRLQDTQTQYTGGSDLTDSFTSPYTTTEMSSDIYPALASVSTDERVREQKYSYDWRGNLSSSSDDANVFFDRSLGTITNNGEGGFDRLASASLGSASSQVQYDQAGNLISVNDTLTGAAYAYSWDELGRLASASRTDAHGTQPAVVEQYAYDTRSRRLRTSRQTQINGTAVVDHTLEVFDSLVLKNAAFQSQAGEYERDAKTQHAYLRAGGALYADVFYDDANLLPTVSGGNGRVHVFMTLGDRLGSTSFVIDRDSSELVEGVGYLAYGGVESDYRPTRWNAFREDIRYGGHWDDASVGLIYYGARFYSPALGRFISPDPLLLHSPAGSKAVQTLIGRGALLGDFAGNQTLTKANPYAYCDGNPIACQDQDGLDEKKITDYVSDNGVSNFAYANGLATNTDYSGANLGQPATDAIQAAQNAINQTLGTNFPPPTYGGGLDDKNPSAQIGIDPNSGQVTIFNPAFGKPPGPGEQPDTSISQLLEAIIRADSLSQQFSQGNLGATDYDFIMSRLAAIQAVMMNAGVLGLSNDQIAALAKEAANLAQGLNDKGEKVGDALNEFDAAKAGSGGIDPTNAGSAPNGPDEEPPPEQQDDPEEPPVPQQDDPEEPPPDSPPPVGEDPNE